MIEHGVVLAAGRGTRLGAVTEEIPKPMLSVGGSTVIGRVIDALVTAGIGDIVVVTGHLAARIEAELATQYSAVARFVRQSAPLGTGHAVALARTALPDRAPFFLGWGDVVTTAADYRLVLDAWAPGRDAVVGTVWDDDPSSGAAVTVSSGGIVTSIVEKPPRRAGGWNSAGLMVLPPAIWDHVVDLEPSPRGELEFTGALAALCGAGGVHAVELGGPWFDVGTPDGLAAARGQYGS